MRGWVISKSSVQNKFLFSALVLILIPLGLFGAVSLQVSKDSIAKQVSRSNLRTLGQVADKTDRLLDDIIAVSNQFYLSAEVSQAFTSNDKRNSYEYAMHRSALDRMLSNATYSFDRLSFQVQLTGLNGFRFPDAPSSPPPDVSGLEDRSWYRSAAEGQGRIVWATEPTPELAGAGGETASFYAVRISKRFETGTPTGIVSIGVNESTLSDLYANALNQDQEIEVVDAAGAVLSSKRKEKIRSSLADRSYYGKIRDYDSGYFIAVEDGRKQLISFQTIGKTGWKLVSYTPKNTVMADLNRLQKIVAVVFGIVAMLAYGASYLLARRLAVPIKRLYQDFGRVEMGDLSVRSPVRSKDEIGHLTRRFNRMVERIEELIASVRVEQERKRRAELQALQSQINPHFLYNTLASIRFMLATRSIETTDSVIVSLVKLLKQSVSKQDELIPIEEEIAMAKHYLFIQSVRQGDRLEIVYELDEAIYEYRTLKLVLQPLVENAIFHGLERKPGGPRRLTIRGALDGPEVRFEIEDNGIGMDVGGLLPAPGGEERHVHAGGLRNVRERIQLYFGENYGIAVESSPRTGTKVVLRIPAIHKWEEVPR